MSTRTKPKPALLVWPPDLFAAAAEHRAAIARRHDAEGTLAYALSLKRDAEQEIRVLESRGIDLVDTIGDDEAAERGVGPGVTATYYVHRMPSAEALADLERIVRDAQQAEQTALRKVEKLRAAGRTFDLVEACRAQGTKWYAARDTALAGRRFWKHEPIPTADMLGIEPWRRARLVGSRHIGELP